MTKLTQKQVDEFRRHPGTFADMVQAIYDAGAEAARERAAKVCEKLAEEADNPSVAYRCSDKIRSWE